MRRITKFFLCIAAALALAVPAGPARADVFGASDAALLAQQIAQFLQDLSLDNKKWADIRARLRQVDDLAKTITKGQNAYTSVKNIVNTSNMVLRTAQDLEWYVEYITEFGDNYSITRAYSIHRTFCRRTNEVISEVGKTIQSFDKLTDLKPLEFLDSMDKATGKACDYTLHAGEIAKQQMLTLYNQMTNIIISKDNAKFKKIKVLS